MNEMSTINFPTKYSKHLLWFTFFLSVHVNCVRCLSRNLMHFLRQKNPKAVVQRYVTPILKGNCICIFSPAVRQTVTLTFCPCRCKFQYLCICNICYCFISLWFETTSAKRPTWSVHNNFTETTWNGTPLCSRSTQTKLVNVLYYF